MNADTLLGRLTGYVRLLRAAVGRIDADVRRAVAAAVARTAERAVDAELGRLLGSRPGDDGLRPRSGDRDESLDRRGWDGVSELDDADRWDAPDDDDRERQTEPSRGRWIDWAARAVGLAVVLAAAAAGLPPSVAAVAVTAAGALILN